MICWNKISFRESEESCFLFDSYAVVEYFGSLDDVDRVIFHFE
jgi:hypothetical protein